MDVDRVSELQNVTGVMDGGVLILTANNDKTLSGNPFLTLDVNQAVTVFVAYDDVHLNIPAWLQSYGESGLKLPIYGNDQSLFGKEFTQGTIEFGGKEGVTESSMYSVIVVSGSASNCNAPPVVDAGANVTIKPSEAFIGAGSITDPDDDSWQAVVDYDDGDGEQPLSLAGNSLLLAILTQQSGRTQFALLSLTLPAAWAQTSWSLRLWARSPPCPE